MKLESLGRRGKVLVIDNEPDIGTAIGRLLRRVHDVAVETEATNALQRLRDGERFDVILCDVQMPVMTGLQFHAAVRELDPSIAERIVFLTGGHGEHVPTSRLSKPFTVEDLRAAVDSRVK